jgi:hypothetical protein
MTRAQVALLLGLAATRDQRNVGETDVMAWHEDIGDLDFEDARAAVSQHFRESTDRIMPAHVRRIAAQIDRDRRKAAREEQERLAIEAADAGRGPTQNRSAEIAEFVARVRDVLPEGDPDTLRYAKGYWREQQEAAEREANAEPNPEYDPTMAQPVGEFCRSKVEPVGAWWEDEAARERHAKEELAKAGRLRRQRTEQANPEVRP